MFDTAYHTNENLLICAPTGAGKTNIALLTVVHQIEQHVENNVIKKDSFKVFEKNEKFIDARKKLTLFFIIFR